MSHTRVSRGVSLTKLSSKAPALPTSPLSQRLSGKRRGGGASSRGRLPGGSGRGKMGASGTLRSTSSTSSLPHLASSTDVIRKMEWEELRELGVSLGLRPSKELPAPVRQAVVRAETVLKQREAEAELMADPREARRRKEADRALDELVKDLKLKLVATHGEIAEATATIRRLEVQLEKERQSVKVTMEKYERDAQTKILEAERKHAMEIARLRSDHLTDLARSPVKGGSPTEDGGATASKAFLMITQLSEKFEIAEREWNAQRAELEEEKRSALREQETTHSDAVQALKEEKWRLQDTVSLLQRQLADMGKDQAISAEREQRSKARAAEAETRADDAEAELRALQTKQTLLEQEMEAYRRHFAEDDGPEQTDEGDVHEGTGSDDNDGEVSTVDMALFT